ncbi:MAG: DUF1761 domain-containing protein [Candidatus Levybacteria bacterium]|nr:DUF1761 domain-containing protein [Candidatus Levybacteria bacterium]
MIEINYIAVLLAAVGATVVGFAWYTVLFGKQYMKIMTESKDKAQHDAKEMGKIYPVNFVVTLVTAFILAHLIKMSASYFGYPMIQAGLTTAFFVWLGFVVPSQLNDNFFGKKTMPHVWINAGNQLAALLVMGIIIGLF